MADPQWMWIATASELPGVGLVFPGLAHRARVVALNGVYTPTACGGVAMAFAAETNLRRCPKCLARPAAPPAKPGVPPNRPSTR